jgi:hypothetical protein
MQNGEGNVLTSFLQLCDHVAPETMDIIKNYMVDRLYETRNIIATDTFFTLMETLDK